MTEAPRVRTARRVRGVCGTQPARPHTRRAPAFRPMRAGSRSAFDQLHSALPDVQVAGAGIDDPATDLIDPVCDVCGTGSAHSHSGRNPKLLLVRQGRARMCDEGARTRLPETRRKPSVCECAKCAPPKGGGAASHTPAATRPSSAV